MGVNVPQSVYWMCVVQKNSQPKCSTAHPVIPSPGVELATMLAPDTLPGFPNIWMTQRIETMEKRTFVDVKNALAAKYERLGRLTSSTPKRTTFAYMALKYRRQAEQAARDGHS